MQLTLYTLRFIEFYILQLAFSILCFSPRVLRDLCALLVLRIFCILRTLHTLRTSHLGEPWGNLGGTLGNLGSTQHPAKT